MTTTTTSLRRHNVGNWIIGTVDGLEVQAKAFEEPSDTYGMPEERRISKLHVRTPGDDGMVLYDFDRGDMGRNYLNDGALAMVIAAVVAKI